MNINKMFKKIIKDNFPALTHSNYRYFWIGQCISLIGTWMQNVGQVWLVYSLTDSPLLTGIVSAVQFIPVTIFSLYAGVVIDKFPKKRILMITQSISMMLALILAILIFTEKVQYFHILVIAFILGCSNTVDMPARQSFMIEITGREHLMNAIALNSMVFNLARIVGPSIGGIILASAGAGWCFLLNGISFIAVLYGISKIQTEPFVRKTSKNVRALDEIKDGLLYIKNKTLLLKTLLMVTITGIFVYNFNVLIPVFTKQTLQMDGKTFGFLMASLGFGSLLGALTASIRGKRGPKPYILAFAAIGSSLGLILTGLSRTYYLAAFFLAMTGLFNIFFSTTSNSTLQINSSDEYRSRVMSVYSLLFAGSNPIGSLLSGAVSDKYSASTAFIVCGVSVLILISCINFIFTKKTSLVAKNN